MRSPRLVLLALCSLAASAALAADLAPLKQALTLHAPFDGSFDAAFSRGDRTLYLTGGGLSGPAKETDAIKLSPGTGRFGGALAVTKKNPVRPFFKGPGAIDYQAADWSGSVSVWLKLTPDEDLEPGYCDPVQIVAGDTKKGFIFLEWSKDESPRHFRFAIRPLFEIWNPKNQDWAKMTDAERPMINLPRAPFARTRWTHVVFTFDRLNAGKAGVGKLYLDGQPQGTLSGWDLTFGWAADKVQLVLAAAYVGQIDDLAVFDRALSPAEVARLHALPGGVADLR
jgi:hypothetical protein